MPGFNFNSGERDRSVAVSPLHVVIMFLVTTFNNYLEVHYQSKRTSPLEDYNKSTMIAIFVTLSMYALCLIAEFRLQIHSQSSSFLPIIERFNPLIGILLVVLHILILFPLLGLVAFIIWTLLMAEAVRKSFPEIRQIFLHGKQIITNFLKSRRSEENGSPNNPTGRHGNEFLPE